MNLDKQKKKILVPVDFSEESKSGLATAANIANRINAELHLIHVINDQEPSELKVAGDMMANKEKQDEHARFLSELVRQKHDQLRKLTDQFLLDGIEMAKDIAFGAFDERLEEYVENNNIDFIVMGSSGETSFMELFTGNHAVKAMRSSNIPVIVTKDYSSYFINGDRLMLLVDDEKYNSETVKMIGDFADLMGMHIFITYIKHEKNSSNDQIRVDLETFARKHNFTDYSFHIIGEGEEVEQINEFAEQAQIDLVASISKGENGLVKLLFGSETEKFLKEIDQPMLVISE